MAVVCRYNVLPIQSSKFGLLSQFFFDAVILTCQAYERVR